MRIGLTFVTAGGGMVLTGIAMTARGAGYGWLALVWAGAGLIIVGSGYLGAGGDVLGKRSDGSIPWTRQILLLPYFLVTWGVWYLLRLSAEPASNAVSPDIHFGRRPLRGELPAGVGWVLDLTAEFTRSPCLPQSCTYHTLPTLDGSVPDENALFDIALRASTLTEPVYIHCAQGHGRAALGAGAILLARGLVDDAHEAEISLRRARPSVHMSAAQREMLGRLAPRLHPVAKQRPSYSPRVRPSQPAETPPAP